MKTLLISVFLTLSLSANSIEAFASKMSYETEYKLAIQKAKQSNKELMFVMVTNYCPWCRKFEKRTLAKEEVNTLVHKKYIPLILNREKGEYPKQFYTKRIPVVMFINANTEEIRRESIGYKKVEGFIKELNK